MKDCDDSSRHPSPRRRAFLISDISGRGGPWGPPAALQSTMSAAVSMYATNSTCGLASFSTWNCLHICTGVVAETQKAECFLKEQTCICQTYFGPLIYNRDTSLTREAVRQTDECSAPADPADAMNLTSWLHPLLDPQHSYISS